VLWLKSFVKFLSSFMCVQPTLYGGTGQMIMEDPTVSQTLPPLIGNEDASKALTILLEFMSPFRIM
jgi:hypothetical protein